MKKHIALLISPMAKSAYFSDYLDVAKAEITSILNCKVNTVDSVGSMEFFNITIEEEDIPQLSYLSCALGAFELCGEMLKPLAQSPSFLLHEDFVFGSKYKGKTNERLTQLLLNLGISSLPDCDFSKVKVLDPMCGRGTTLMWAMLMGFQSKGIERDTKALADFRTNTKKWCKLHRQKHKLNEGFVSKANKKQAGKFIEFSVPIDSESKSLKNVLSTRMISGDAANADQLLNAEKFDLIISDLPYGVQHNTPDGKRNPLETIDTCIPAWKRCLKPHGAIVLAYNKYIPKRTDLIRAFEHHGFSCNDFEAPHRMSESIVRDIAIFQPTTA